MKRTSMKGTGGGRTEESGVNGLEGGESVVESKDLGGADESEVPEESVSYEMAGVYDYDSK